MQILTLLVLAAVLIPGFRGLYLLARYRSTAAPLLGVGVRTKLGQVNCQGITLEVDVLRDPPERAVGLMVWDNRPFRLNNRTPVVLSIAGAQALLRMVEAADAGTSLAPDVEPSIIGPAYTARVLPRSTDDPAVLEFASQSLIPYRKRIPLDFYAVRDLTRLLKDAVTGALGPG